MARKPNVASATISKSQAVRDYLTEHPTAMPKEIAPAVKTAHGLDVSPQMISMIKSKLGKKSRRRGRKGRAAAAGVSSRATNSARFTIEDLVTAQKLAQSMGGIPRAQEALAALAALARLSVTT